MNVISRRFNTCTVGDVCLLRVGREAEGRIANVAGYCKGSLKA